MGGRHVKLIDTLEWLAAELAAGSTLPLCLRRLPHGESQLLCAPLPPLPVWRRWWRREAPRAAESMALARIALAAGADDPARLAAGLAQLAADLRETSR